MLLQRWLTAAWNLTAERTSCPASKSPNSMVKKGSVQVTCQERERDTERAHLEQRGKLKLALD